MSENDNPVGIGLPQRERMPRIDYMRKLSELDRQRNPHLYLASPDGLGPKWLFVENVAAMFGCTIDFVRRISRQELPAGTIGKRVVYSRDDVDAFIARRLQASNSRFVAHRKVRVASSEAAPVDGPTSSFDPIAVLRTYGGTK